MGYSREKVLSLIPEVPISEIVIYLLSYLYYAIPNIFLILLFTCYMLIEQEKEASTPISRRIDIQIRRYIMLKAALAVVTGVLIGLMFVFMKTHPSIVFGFIAFLLYWIPNIGQAVSTLIPLPFLILDPNISILKTVLAFFIPAAIQVIMGKIVEPNLAGRLMDLPALTVLVCLMFWTLIWGVIGAVLSVPLTVFIRTYLLYIDHPMPQFLANMIVGEFSFGTESATTTTTTTTTETTGEPTNQLLRLEENRTSSSSSSSSNTEENRSS